MVNFQLIIFRKIKYFLHGSYVQYVQFTGRDRGSEIINEKQIKGCLSKMLPQLESFVRDAVVTSRPIPISMLREKNILNYPDKALRELLMNACLCKPLHKRVCTGIISPICLSDFINTKTV